MRKRDPEGMAAQILTPDNYHLFDLVREQLNEYPQVPIAATARGLGVTPDALCRWFIGFKEYRPPAVLPSARASGLPRDPELRAELMRLRRRESSLVTVATEAPAQLAVVQGRIRSLERTR